MDNPFSILYKSIYQKIKIKNPEIDIGLCIAITKYLSKNKDILSNLKKVVQYLFYIETQYYYYLLYCNIPKSSYVPFFGKSKKEEVKENKLIDRIQKTLGWTNKELKGNMNILKKNVLSNEKYWKEQLGIS